MLNYKQENDYYFEEDYLTIAIIPVESFLKLC
ncbi:hypothetical protein CY0110_19992 [Crocosphaera chwakensis CCY0110]|uniref:Uncharacterized protein n=1 Tax=Crocosphaera chwakensis CCY0110 TaxID=391612 RepID=A3IJY0_9CHRO|nr:hypothetical protein CY0110_19992 [Crocosphaera chwakensis CCY0110]